MMRQGSTDWRMQSPGETKVATMGLFIYLADVDAHYERARAAGADIVQAREERHKEGNRPWGSLSELALISPRTIFRSTFASRDRL
jgi:uncharacterized glyoxalase superfamily protein PhnB